MADWCIVPAGNISAVRRLDALASNGYWCEFTFNGGVTIDFAGVSDEYGSGIGSVVPTAVPGEFIFTPPPGLNTIDVILYGGGGGAGGASSGTEGCVGGCGYNGRAGYGGSAGQKVAETTVPVASHTITIGLGGMGGPGGNKSGDTDNPNGGTNGIAGGTTEFSGVPIATGGAFGYATDDECGNSGACPDGTPGIDSEIGLGGLGGDSDGSNGAGGNGYNGGLSAGGGGGGGGGGGDNAGDDGEHGGGGGSGGNGRIVLSWYSHFEPTTQATWC